MADLDVHVPLALLVGCSGGTGHAIADTLVGAGMPFQHGRRRRFSSRSVR